jgi:hypothetical protein
MKTKNTLKTPAAALLAVLLCVSCTDFFTTSLGEWAARDPNSLIPSVTTGNIDDLLEAVEGDPDLALALLKKIADADPDPKLQAAALEAATEASGIVGILSTNINDIDENNAEAILISALNSMSNVEEAGAVLVSILPDPTSDPTGYAAFVAKASAEDLAMAAAVILAGEAKASGDPSNYISGFPTSSTGTATQELAKQLAQAAAANYTGGGFLEDFLKGIGLTT